MASFARGLVYPCDAGHIGVRVSEIDRGLHAVDPRKAQKETTVACGRDPGGPVLRELGNELGPDGDRVGSSVHGALLPSRCLFASEEGTERARTPRPVMFWELAGVPAVAVRRGGRVESLHHIAACVSDVDGTIVAKAGTIETPVFLRSSAKPFIAAASVREGVLERFGFGDRELALMCASHNGEPGHVELVASMLARIGATVDDLACGVHPPAYEPAAAALAARGEVPSQLHNNCSGKHAGILALAKVLGAPFAGYLDPQHPAQRAIIALCERVSDDVFDGDKLAVDGCGIPVYATSLRKAARSFARLATLRGVDDGDATALARVAGAMTAEPWYVGGTGRFDTDLMRATRGRIVCKAGAEGVHCDAVLDAGLGVALKVIDGSRRATAPAVLAVLDALRAFEPGARASLQQHAVTPVKNVAGRIVGEVAALDGFLSSA